jgi:hypothetical protein
VLTIDTLDFTAIGYPLVEHSSDMHPSIGDNSARSQNDSATWVFFQVAMRFAGRIVDSLTLVAAVTFWRFDSRRSMQ